MHLSSQSIIIINKQCRCAVCRSRKSRCITRNAGACERCVEKGEECDFAAAQALQSSAVTDTPEPRCKTRDGDDTSSSLQTTQVSDVSHGASSTVETTSEVRPAGTKPVCRIRASGELPPADSEASESAILIVEDLGRTREFILCR